MTSVLGTILDPAADKALVGTLVVTLTMQGLLPCESFVPRKNCILILNSVPLATIIVGRDLLLSLSAFYIRYTSLPHPVGRPLYSCGSRTEHSQENISAILGFLYTICRSAPYDNQ